MPLKVILCVPTRKKPHPACYESLEKSEQIIKDAGFDYGISSEVGNPYISGARATMLKRALASGGDIFIFIDDDVSWEPSAILKLIQTPGEVVGGTYRTKQDDEVNYMGRILQDDNGFPTSIRQDGCIECVTLPAGFLKVTKEAVHKYGVAYPDLCYGPIWDQAVDLFQHGAYRHLWWGEDYAFCRRWRDMGNKVWMVPNINVDHNAWDSDKVYKGNFHEYLLSQPGGKNSDSWDPENRAASVAPIVHATMLLPEWKM